MLIIWTLQRTFIRTRYGIIYSTLIAYLWVALMLVGLHW